jgi:hypothetical protein
MSPGLTRYHRRVLDGQMSNSNPVFIDAAGLVERGWAKNRKTIDRAAQNGELPFVQVGRRRLFPMRWVEAVEAGDVAPLDAATTGDVSVA